MKIIKQGGHRLFEQDEETTTLVKNMLIEFEKGKMDAIRKYSILFDDWNPDNFELTEKLIQSAISQCDKQLIEDTDFCQQNVRTFAQAQLALPFTHTPLPYALTIFP